MLLNCGLIVRPCWPTLKSTCIAVPLAKEPFTNKGPEVFQSLAAQNPAEMRFKLVGFLFFYCCHINPTFSQQFSQAAKDGPRICATWE